MISIFKERLARPNQFTTDNIQFAYQSEFYSLAWGKVHHGFYILPDGTKYSYREPENWNFHTTKENESIHNFNTAWGYETDGMIAPTALFENLAKSKKYKPLFSFMQKSNPINTPMLDDLQGAEVIDYGIMATDQGTLSNSVLFYDGSINVYRRVLITSKGQRDKVNQSQHTNSIIKELGETPFRRY